MELWTLSELAERVEAALADYPGQANGRVRAVPDQRAIRWYTTTGLIDRPAEMRGRTALYGRRHLLQLVAIKRRQAQGRTLAQIQSELAGAPDRTLEPIAALPADLQTRPAPASAASESIASAPASVAPQSVAPAPQPRARFWADSPEAAAVDTAPAEPPRPATPSASGVAVVGALRLGEGVTVVLDQGVGGLDTERLAAAAAPFLAELRRQGLLSRSSGDES